jgi:hypothetical protein
MCGEGRQDERSRHAAPAHKTPTAIRITGAGHRRGADDVVVERRHVHERADHVVAGEDIKTTWRCRLVPARTAERKPAPVMSAHPPFQSRHRNLVGRPERPTRF